jgi:type II secretory pathway pseudopilin PulG
LVELLVAVFLLSIVLGSIYMGLDSMQNSAAGATERLVNLDEARVLMATLTRDIRSAARLSPTSSPFVLAADRELIFYSNIAATQPPNRVRIYVDADNRLVEEVIAPTGSNGNYEYNRAPTVRVVGAYVVSGYDIFNYYDAAGNELTTRPMTAQDLLNIKQVEVTISIRSGPRADIATTLVNRVRLPNVDWNPVVGN